MSTFEGMKKFSDLVPSRFWYLVFSNSMYAIPMFPVLWAQLGKGNVANLHAIGLALIQ